MKKQQVWKRVTGAGLTIIMGMGITFSSMADVADKPTYRNEVIGIHSNQFITDPRYTGLTGCSLSIAAGSNGVLVDASTGFTLVADEIGIKNLKIQKKSGSTWSTVYSLSKNFESNEASYGYSVTKLANPSDSEYRASVTYYAIYGGKTYTLSDTTDSISY